MATSISAPSSAPSRTQFTTRDSSVVQQLSTLIPVQVALSRSGPTATTATTTTMTTTSTSTMRGYRDLPVKIHLGHGHSSSSQARGCSSYYSSPTTHTATTTSHSVPSSSDVHTNTTSLRDVRTTRMASVPVVVAPGRITTGATSVSSPLCTFAAAASASASSSNHASSNSNFNRCRFVTFMPPANIIDAILEQLLFLFLSHSQPQSQLQKSFGSSPVTQTYPSHDHNSNCNSPACDYTKDNLAFTFAQTRFICKVWNLCFINFVKMRVHKGGVYVQLGDLIGLGRCIADVGPGYGSGPNAGVVGIRGCALSCSKGT